MSNASVVVTNGPATTTSGSNTPGTTNNIVSGNTSPVVVVEPVVEPTFEVENKLPSNFAAVGIVTLVIAFGIVWLGFYSHLTLYRLMKSECEQTLNEEHCTRPLAAMRPFMRTVSGFNVFSSVIVMIVILGIIVALAATADW